MDSLSKMNPDREKHVLVAEDTDGDYFMLRKAFLRTSRRHTLHRVRDGLELVAYVSGQPPYGNREQWPLPDLIILDLLLPKLKGFESLEYLKRELRVKIPVIILSGSAIAPERRKAMELGAAHYFVKPVTFEAASELVESIQNSWLK